MNPQAPHRLPLHLLAAAAVLSCGVLLSACGGGGGSDTALPTTTTLSEPDATADAANASSTGSDTALAMDTALDTTSVLALAVATPASASTDRAQALSTDAHADTAGVPVSNLTIDCAGGGTATLSITGGTALSQLNGQLDAGEHYSVAYAQCAGKAGYAQMNGSVEMDVMSADDSTSPTTLAVSLTVTSLSLALPSGSVTLDGTATVSRSVVVAGGTTTTTSHVTVPSATLSTAFNSRSGSFTLSGLDATRTLTAIAGAVSASQYNGRHTLSGTADARTFTLTASTTGNTSYDATGALVAGAWTVIRPLATIVTTVANGTAIMTVDDGNDGTIDHTWTFPTTTLNAAAG